MFLVSLTQPYNLYHLYQRMTRFRFRFSRWPTLVTVAGIALAIALGTWQLNRGNAKSLLRDQLVAANRGAPLALPASEVDTASYALRRVTVSGRFDPQLGVYVDNKVMNGVAGYDVVMPLDIQRSGRYVLVDRGWVPAAASRTQLPQVQTPPGDVEVTGIAVEPPARYFELSGAVAEGKVLENLTLAHYQQAFKIPLQPVVIEQDNDLHDDLVRSWPPLDLKIDMHYGYAFQWYAMGAALLIFYLVTHVKRIQQQD